MVRLRKSATGKASHPPSWHLSEDGEHSLCHRYKGPWAERRSPNDPEVQADWRHHCWFCADEVRRRQKTEASR